MIVPSSSSTVIDFEGDTLSTEVSNIEEGMSVESMVIEGKSFKWNQLMRHTSGATVTLTEGHKFYCFSVLGAGEIIEGDGTVSTYSWLLPVISDLTLTYGAGNEPTDTEEFNNLFMKIVYSEGNNVLNYNEGCVFTSCGAFDGSGWRSLNINLSDMDYMEEGEYTEYENVIHNSYLASVGNSHDTLTITRNSVRVNRVIGKRAYQSGDENDNTVLTDGHAVTYYVLAEPVVETYPATEFMYAYSPTTYVSVNASVPTDMEGSFTNKNGEIFISASTSNTVDVNPRITFEYGQSTFTANKSSIKSFSISQDGCASGQFTVGSTSSATLNITLLTSFVESIGSTQLDNIVVKPYIAYNVGGDNYLEIQRGKYVIDGSQTKREGLFTSVTAYDVLYSDNMNETIPAAFISGFSASSSPKTNIQLFSTATGFSLKTTGVADTGTTPILVDADMTCREVLSRLAMSAGANCMTDSVGDIVFKFPSNTSSVRLGASNYEKMTIDKYDNTSISYMFADIDGDTYYYPNKLTDTGIGFDSTYLSSPSDLQTIWDRTVQGTGGISYTGVDVTLFDCPFIEPFDLITITDLNESTYGIMPLSLKLSYDGGIKTSISANTIQEGSGKQTKTQALQQSIGRLESKVMQDRLHYVVCNTFGNVATKVITFNGFEKYNGVTLSVFFTHGNTANGVSLNINSEGFPSPVYANGSPLTESSTFNWTDNQIVDFIFDNGKWIIAGTNVSRYIDVIEGAGGTKTLTIAENVERTGFHVDISATKLAMCHTVEQSNIKTTTDMVAITQAGITVGDRNFAYVYIEDNGISIAQGQTEANLFSDCFYVPTTQVQQIIFAESASASKLVWEKRNNGHLSLKVV